MYWTFWANKATQRGMNTSALAFNEEGTSLISRLAITSVMCTPQAVQMLNSLQLMSTILHLINPSHRPDWTYWEANFDPRVRLFSKTGWRKTEEIIRETLSLDRGVDKKEGIVPVGVSQSMLICCAGLIHKAINTQKTSFMLHSQHMTPWFLKRILIHTYMHTNLPLQSVSDTRSLPLSPTPVNPPSSNHYSDNPRDPPTSCKLHTSAHMLVQEATSVSQSVSRSHTGDHIVRHTQTISQTSFAGSRTRLCCPTCCFHWDIHHRSDGNRDNGHKLASCRYAKRGSNN